MNETEKIEKVKKDILWQLNYAAQEIQESKNEQDLIGAYYKVKSLMYEYKEILYPDVFRAE